MPYFGASRFTDEPETDSYCCPDDQTLQRDHAKYTDGKVVYHAAPGIRDACALRSQCICSKDGRRTHRNIDEDYLDRVRSYHETEAYEKAMRKRRLGTEPLWRRLNQHSRGVTRASSISLRLAGQEVPWKETHRSKSREHQDQTPADQHSPDPEVIGDQCRCPRTDEQGGTPRGPVCTRNPTSVRVLRPHLQERVLAGTD